MSFSGIVIVETNVGKAVQVTRDIEQGHELYSFVGKILDKPNMHTVQLSETKHIECQGGPEFTAHSCDPNALMKFVDTSTTKLVATRLIKKGELVSFNYCSTEWDMSTPFQCKCGTTQCFGEIRGFKHCTKEQRSQLQSSLSPYLLSKIEAQPLLTSLPNITIVETDVGKAVEATRDIAKGQELYSFVGRVIEKPNVFTVQLSETKHLECEGGPEFTAHSCDPNSKMVFGDTHTSTTKLVATRAIKKGELISFNYCSTEWDMASTFKCNCGSTNCFGEIRGYKHCTEEQRSELQGSLAPYLLSKIKSLDEPKQ
jgi:SET domain-containing protein